MAPLLWTLEDAQRFTTEVKGLRLAVMPAKIAGLYRYQVFKRSSDSSVYALNFLRSLHQAAGSTGGSRGSSYKVRDC